MHYRDYYIEGWTYINVGMQRNGMQKVDCAVFRSHPCCRGLDSHPPEASLPNMPAHMKPRLFTKSGHAKASFCTNTTPQNTRWFVHNGTLFLQKVNLLVTCFIVFRCPDSADMMLIQSKATVCAEKHPHYAQTSLFMVQGCL